MKYEDLSKFLVKLNQRFFDCVSPVLFLESGHKLCLITIVQKIKNSNTP